MTAREIRAMLRGATRDGLLDRWFYDSTGCYIVVPSDSNTTTYTEQGARAYCTMLSEAGVEPYRPR